MNEVEAVALKPCPFCGGEAVMREYDSRHPYEAFGLIADHAVDCFLNLHNSSEDWLERWNTRAALDAARGDVVAWIAAWLMKQPPHLSLQEYAQAIEAREWGQCV